MRKRDMGLAKIKQNAEAFGIEPELQWLMDANASWQSLCDGIRLINKGMVIDLSEPIDKMRDHLLVLGALFGERRG